MSFDQNISRFETKKKPVLMFVNKIYSKRFALDKKNAHFRTKRQCNSDLVKKEATNVNFSQNYPIKLCSDKNNAVVRTKKEITSALTQSHEKRKQQTSYFEKL